MSKTSDIQNNNQELQDLIAVINELPTSPLIEHAYRHAIDGEDPITPASIGAVPAPIYFPLEQPDLNTVLDTGYYMPAAAAFCTTALNFPLEGVSGMLQVSTVYTTTYQVFLTTTNRLFIRGYIASQWNNWAEIYSAVNNPTPAQIGAVAKSGDTMTGPLYIDRGGQQNTVITQSAPTETHHYSDFIHSDIDGGKIRLRLQTIDGSGADIPLKQQIRLLVQQKDSSSYTGYNLYGAHNKPTPSDIGALATTGGTVTGDITIQKTTTIADNKPAQILFSTVQSDNNITTPTGKIMFYDDHDKAANGGNMVIQGAGNMIIGAGESPSTCYTTDLKDSTSENMYIISDGNIYFYSNCQTYANKKTIYIDTSGVLHGTVSNDYAEFRTQVSPIEPGYCVYSNNAGQVSKTTEKFQACDGIVSDTFGFSIGETDECKTPLAVAGRVLAYCDGDRKNYNAGDTVCAGPDGKVVKMTREEIKEYPDRIVGIVSEIPEYETWGAGNVQVNGRIWIKVK